MKPNPLHRVGLKYGSLIYVQAAIFAATGIKLTTEQTIKYLFEEGMITQSSLVQLTRVDFNQYAALVPVKPKAPPERIFPLLRDPEERWELLKENDYE